MFMNNPLTVIQHIRSGRVRGMAVTGNARFAELPNVPTVAEGGVPGYSVTGWYGLYATAGTPVEVVKRLHEESRRALASPDIKDKLVKAGNDLVGTGPAEFLNFVKAEYAKWAKVIPAAGIKG